MPSVINYDTLKHIVKENPTSSSTQKLSRKLGLSKEAIVGEVK